jgi:hypothetical protein
MRATKRCATLVQEADLATRSRPDRFKTRISQLTVPQLAQAKRVSEISIRLADVDREFTNGPISDQEPGK